jgi:predicted GH43/DUF377 family glycosyl hydrolase
MGGTKKPHQVPNISLVLERFAGNPILTPKPGHRWESKAVFNTAAIYEGGKVHLLYRALGENDVSTIGYATSLDGFNIHERLSYPVYVPRASFEGVSPVEGAEPATRGIYASGGGEMGGCEDPRLTRIGDTVYITYVAYDGRSQPRVALSSIALTDFLNRKWNWKKPVLISPPHIVDKNACLLPEKINGKYVVFHRIFPNILIDFVDNLDFDGESRWLTGQYEIPVRALSSDWDSRKVGCGPPPLKTKYGWLLIYQAVSNGGAYHYKIGSMLLDIKDPTKVLARSRNPVLAPEVRYENEGWKGGVVYPCGAAIIDERLFIYYGSADTVICVASVKLNGFIEQLAANHAEPVVQSIAIEPPTMVKEVPQKIKGYCLKCKKKRSVQDPHQSTLKNKRGIIKGVCPKCGSNIIAFMPAAKPVKKTARKKTKGTHL